MNILFLTDDNLLRSVVYDIHLLAEGLSLRGHQVEVVSSQRGEGIYRRYQATSLARIYPHSRVRLHRTDSLNLPWGGALMGVVSSFSAIGDVLALRDIDVIVAYSVVRTGLPALFLARKKGIPVVFRNIDMLHQLVANKFGRGATLGLEKWVYRGVNRFLTLSPAYGNYLARMGVSASRMRELPFPLDLQIFRPGIDVASFRRSWGLSDGEDIFLYVGGLYPFSGLLEFIRLFPSIVEKIPRAKLVVVGDGPLRRPLEKRVLALGLQKRVMITGVQPYADIPKFISMSKICLNLYPADGEMKNLFCAKVVQYLACGRPAVSTALPGMITAIPGEASGVVYVKDVPSVAQTLVELAGDPQKCALLGERGRSYVERFHNIETIVERLEEELRQVCVSCRMF